MSIFTALKHAIFGKPRPKGIVLPSRALSAEQTRETNSTPLAPSIDAIALNIMPSEAKPTGLDIHAVLSEAARGHNLNWQTSVVDLLKLLDIDSSLANRRKLAENMGFNGALDAHDALNSWLYTKVLDKLSANNGQVPDSLKD